MKASIIKEGDFYSATAPNGWEILDMPVDEAIKKYCGKRTIMLMWDDDINEKLKYTTVLPSFQDSSFIANKTADDILSKIKKQLVNAI